MESSTPDPAGQPDPTGQPAQVPNLSLDDVPAAEPSAPDLDAVATEQPAVPFEQSVSFDLGDGGYAETLARTGYGSPAPAEPVAAPPPPEPPAVGYQQPSYAPSAGYQSGTPYAQPNPYAQADPYAQQNPYPQANPYAQPVPYAPVAPYAQRSDALSPDEERTWASAAHWSALVTSVVGLGFLGPLLVYLIQGPKSAWVKAQAAESLNFEITYVIAMIASLVAMLVAIGFVTIFVFPVLWLVFRIVATVATAQGRDYRYPINIRMVK